ncbi:MAG: hypothetical protein R2834_23795 [Rhodothermales bacterium]
MPLNRRQFVQHAGLALAAASLVGPGCSASAAPVSRRLYVATPGIRNYLEYGGIGVIVFDIDNGHRFVKRIPTWDLVEGVDPENVKGVAASGKTGRLYVSTIKRVGCIDLHTEKMLWDVAYEGGCDRLTLSPDGTVLYIPSLEKGHWHVADAMTGDVLARIEVGSGAHNTIYGLDGKEVYLAGLRSPLLSVADTATHTVKKTVGPFSNPIRPFTVNGSQTLCFVNVNELLGFEIGDLKTGDMLHRVEVAGFEKGPVKRHGCPSHGIGMTPDEREIWVSDGANSHMHVFDATVMPPRQIASLPVRDQPGWVTFSLDGKYAYPSTGEVFDVATKEIVATLTDETGLAVGSEKMVEVHLQGDRITETGDQFGIGRIA